MSVVCIFLVLIAGCFSKTKKTKVEKCNLIFLTCLIYVSNILNVNKLFKSEYSKSKILKIIQMSNEGPEVGMLSVIWAIVLAKYQRIQMMEQC